MTLTAPFLKDITLKPDGYDREVFPFNHLAYLKSDFHLEFRKPITFIVGENGSGKSTLMEAIAKTCGFHESGGSQDHYNYSSTDRTESELFKALRASWLPKVNQGFFFRSESFFNLANYIDDYGDLGSYYGGKKMHGQSHGESFLSLFQNRFGSNTRAIYLMDEPEAALSPTRQLSFLSLLHQWHDSGNVQLIIATHSPILLAYPHADIYQIAGDEIILTPYEETEHYKITRRFLNNPERFLKELM